MDVPVKMVFLPQNAQRFDHQFHGAVRAAQYGAGQKQTFDVVAAVEADGQIGQLSGSKGGAGPIIGTAIDAVAAIVGTGVGIKHFEQRYTATILCKSVADACSGTTAQAAMLAGAVHTAGGTGDIIFGAIGQDFQFLTQVHKKFS